jgi:hypothetical protein
MNTNPLKQGILTENSSGVGSVTRAMVRERAVELTVINGHSAQEVSTTEWEQAKWELTGVPESSPGEQDHEFGYQLMRRIAEVAIKCLQATQQSLIEEARRSGPPTGSNVE